MIRNFRAAAVAALAFAVAGAGLTGCDEISEAVSSPSPAGTAAEKGGGDALTGTQKIDVGGKRVNVSCAGEQADGRPVVVLMPGLGDGLDKMAALQKTLSERQRVCSYDRLGQGASDKPDGPQTLAHTGDVLTGVLDKVVGDVPVVLAGHSMGGLIAARYAPDHQDRVKGVVLMDATSPTTAADTRQAIPENATGPAAQVRAQNLAVTAGQNPEMLTVPDGAVRSAGDIPVEVIQHGKPFLAAVPQYGQKLEQVWAKGQRAWTGLSSGSKLRTAENSAHHIYLDEPQVAVQAVQRVADQVATG
ncbi:alpha/beta fold hydrolase [Actinomadura welshii]